MTACPMRPVPITATVLPVTSSPRKGRNGCHDPYAVLFDEVKELLDDVRLMGLPTAIVTDLTAQIQFRKVV